MIIENIRSTLDSIQKVAGYRYLVMEDVEKKLAVYGSFQTTTYNAAANTTTLRRLFDITFEQVKVRQNVDIFFQVVPIILCLGPYQITLMTKDALGNIEVQNGET